MTIALLATVALGLGQTAEALNLLNPGDFIISVNRDQDSSLDHRTNQSYPDGERPQKAIDGTNSKYLNFRKENSGFIVTPDASSIVKSMVITTANDTEARDPASYLLYGTNEPISSGNNSAGYGEEWTLIATGPLDLPKGPGSRHQPGLPVDFADNTTAYSSYRLTFPTLHDGPSTNSMQIAEVQFFDELSGAGNPIFSPDNEIISVLPTTYPVAEGPANLIDGDTDTKFLSFGRENTGVIVTPGVGPSILNRFTLNLAGDSERFPGRDPVAFEIYGTNDPIDSKDDSRGDNEVWTLLNSGSMNYEPQDRGLVGPFHVGATEYYSSYKIIFPALRDSASVDSVQISELQLIGSVPEPSTVALAGLGLLGLVACRRLSLR